MQLIIDYNIELPPFRAELVAEIAGLCEAVFKEAVSDLQWRLENMPCQTVVCARASGHLVAFKAGYAMSKSKYYSWLGGVHPNVRRQGIASRLMELQHAHVSDRGFETIETAADEGNTGMAQVNLKHGYVVCGIRSKPKRVQVLFSKSLALCVPASI
jgi:GNAT superfamily N-acetyltransferase